MPPSQKTVYVSFVLTHELGWQYIAFDADGERLLENSGFDTIEDAIVNYCEETGLVTKPPEGGEAVTKKPRRRGKG